MKYFSGFCLKDEEELFKDILEDGEFVVAGFSKGAQDALDFALNAPYRIDKLQLISPAFFNYGKKIVDLNIKAFIKNKHAYIKNFLTKAGLYDKKYIAGCTQEDLKRLFEYDWRKLKNLKNVDIEIYIGEKDKIIDPKGAYSFFKNYGCVFYIKGANHFLRRSVGKE
ncbi:MAG: pimelyl-ACP methyl ester esterase BioV [Epsilonproteobacteria bacterium]|nr:pimelyl-ACP methyl ester esterase BioV [Campylobacterota bacterium]